MRSSIGFVSVNICDIERKGEGRKQQQQQQQQRKKNTGNEKKYISDFCDL